MIMCLVLHYIKNYALFYKRVLKKIGKVQLIWHPSQNKLFTYLPKRMLLFISYLFNMVKSTTCKFN